MINLIEGLKELNLIHFNSLLFPLPLVRLLLWHYLLIFLILLLRLKKRNLLTFASPKSQNSIALMLDLVGKLCVLLFLKEPQLCLIINEWLLSQTGCDSLLVDSILALHLLDYLLELGYSFLELSGVVILGNDRDL